jgi:hypothetical protein
LSFDNDLRRAEAIGGLAFYRRHHVFGKSNIESRLRRSSYQVSVSPGQNVEYSVQSLRYRSLAFLGLHARTSPTRFISLTSVRKLLAPPRYLIWLKPSKFLTTSIKTKYYFYQSLAGPDGQELLSAQRSKLALNGRENEVGRST